MCINFNYSLPIVSVCTRVLCIGCWQGCKWSLCSMTLGERMHWNPQIFRVTLNSCVFQWTSYAKMAKLTLAVSVSSWALVCDSFPSRHDIWFSLLCSSWASFCRLFSMSWHDSDKVWFSLFNDDWLFFSSSTFLFCTANA